MLRKACFAILASAGLLVAAPHAEAQDPFGFQFGYTLGYQNSFRNRLPTPPYFAVYPPVYYGKRYARPYGESPFAAFPQLQPSADYQPTPYGATYRTRAISNPHIQHPMPHGHRIQSEPVASVDATYQSKPSVSVIINPFTQPQVAKHQAE
jgi:hypothetical protein